MHKQLSLLFLILCSWNISADILKYEFKDWSGSPLTTYVAKPSKIDAATRLVVVIHGRKRNAEEYRDQWVQASKDLNLLVIVPEYSHEDFAEVWGFNYGNIKSKTLEPISKDLHAFSTIEPLVNNALNKFKLKSDHWGIYGHGAGAHFVHRYLLHRPEDSHTLAIAANLGWYLSLTDQEWPFGLKNSEITNSHLQKSFSKYFLLMLGRSDVSSKPNTPYVKKNWDAISSQGNNRLERGRNFFKSAVEKSKEVDQFFKWGMVEVPTKEGHGNTQQMVPYAAEMFFARLK